jgi:hypothetical protein
MKRTFLLSLCLLVFVSVEVLAEAGSQRFSFCMEADEILCFQCRVERLWVACRYLQGGDKSQEGFVGDIFWKEGDDELVVDSQAKIMELFRDEKIRKEVEEIIKKNL